MCWGGQRPAAFELEEEENVHFLCEVMGVHALGKWAHGPFWVRKTSKKGLSAPTTKVIVQLFLFTSAGGSTLWENGHMGHLGHDKHKKKVLSASKRK